MSQRQMEYVSISKITPYWNNPRNNEAAVDGVMKSIKEFDFLVPIVVDSEGIIVTGHTRYAASVKLGLAEVPVISADHLSPEQVKAFRLADNRVAENATWDETKLAEELRQLQEMGFDLQGTGFSAEELDCLCGVISASCLDDLDYATVCGQVAVAEVKTSDTIIISIGLYKFRLSTGDYTKWEAKMQAQYPVKADLIRHLGKALGFDHVTVFGGE